MIKNDFWASLKAEKPLQIVGVINAYAALMAQRVGFKALYLSGAGVANASYGLPDTGITSLENVLADVRRITGATDLPLLVDIDTGWTIARTIREMEKSGVAAVHLEDQVFEKRCGHLPGKQLVSKEEMVERIKAAVDARENGNFVIMARTDALAVEGLDLAIERAVAYKEAGADMLFPEALTELNFYQSFKDSAKIPILANLTEFGKTPLFTLDELKSVDVDMALYPLSANRAMNLAAMNVLKEIRKKGTQKEVVDKMQTRQELYSILEDHHLWSKQKKAGV